MTPLEAAKILELAPDASPDQIEARFLELRRKLEDKIAKAPTPGLQAKYRATLAEVTTAFETLTLAADSSSLPVLQRNEPVKPAVPPAAHSPVPQGPAAGPREAAPPPAQRAPRKKSSNKEFLLVAAVAAAVLGLGGWWVMKTREENAEKLRLAVAAREEAERQQALAKQQAEEKRLREEAERAQAAAAEKAEHERQEKLSNRLRARLAELNVTYEATMRSEQVAERELTNLKNQEREMARDAKTASVPAQRTLAARVRAQEAFVTWMGNALPAHPAKIARARAEELLSARAVDDAAVAIEDYVKALQQLQNDLTATRTELFSFTGGVAIKSNLEGVDWKFTDAYGQEHTGTTPALLADIPVGRINVVFSYGSFPPIMRSGEVSAKAAAVISTDFIYPTLTVNITPKEAKFIVSTFTKDSGQTLNLFPGYHVCRVEAPGYAPQEFDLTVKPGEKIERQVTLSNDPMAFFLAEILSGVSAVNKANDTYFTENFGYLVPAAFAMAGDETNFNRATSYIVNPGDKPKIAILWYRMTQPRGGALLGWTSGIPKEFPAWTQERLFGPKTEQTPEQKRQAEAALPPDQRIYSRVDAAVELIVAGKNPQEAGLTEPELDRVSATIATRLIQKHNQPDLAATWFERWRTRQKKLEKNAGIVDRMHATALIQAYVAKRHTNHAIAEFDRALAVALKEDPTLAYFRTDVRNLLSAARSTGNRRMVDLLTQRIITLQRNMPPGYVAAHYNADDWMETWIEPLRLAGRGDQLLAAGAEKLHASIPLEPTASGSGYFCPKTEKSSAHTLLTIFLAKTQVIKGDKVSAYAIAGKTPQPDNVCDQIALTYGSLGNWDAAMDACERRMAPPFFTFANNQDLKKIVGTNVLHMRYELAQIYGTRIGEQMEPDAALATLKRIREPVYRTIALSAYVIRYIEFKKMTDEEQAYIRTLPPL